MKTKNHAKDAERRMQRRKGKMKNDFCVSLF